MLEAAASNILFPCEIELDFERNTVWKMLHTTHKGGSLELSHAQKYNKQGGWLREKCTAASLHWSGLK
jgi:hypothetical protein